MINETKKIKVKSYHETQHTSSKHKTRLCQPGAVHVAVSLVGLEALRGASGFPFSCQGSQ